VPFEDRSDVELGKEDGYSRGIVGEVAIRTGNLYWVTQLYLFFVCGTGA
jgi:hypothetical protein